MLNEEQTKVVQWATSNVLENKSPFFTLVGAGGTGKTHSVMAVVRQLQAAGLKVLLTAPTNKAVKQLERAAEKHQLEMDDVAFQTIHSALGLAMLPNEDRKFAARAGKGVIGLFDLVVIDESSMLSRILLNRYLLPDCEQNNTKVMFMGDDMQLPPVREKVSEVFTSFPLERLVVNERQNSGELLDMNTSLRGAIFDNRVFKAEPARGEQIHEVKAAKYLSTLLEEFDENTDLDSVRVLAWTNRRVQQLNQAIRNKLFGKKCDPYVVGERVVTGAPVKGPENEIVLGTDEECEITHVNEDSFVYDEQSETHYATRQLVLQPLYLDFPVVVEVLQEESEEDFKERLNSLANAARNDTVNSRRLWAMFWQFKELFADIRHCYCITVHRSQGSTFDKVFVDVKDILRNNNRIERQRLLYVGFSRPRSELVINKSSYTA